MIKVLSSVETLLCEIFSDRSITEARFDNDDMLIICFFKSCFNVNSSKSFSKSYTNNTGEAEAEGCDTDSEKLSVFFASLDSF